MPSRRFPCCRPMRFPYFALALLALALPLAALRAEPLVVGKLEASNYSLPNVVASATWQVEPEGVVLAEDPNPTLTLPWRTAVHASGSKVDIEYTVRLYSDGGFPSSPDEDWKLEWQDKQTIRARGRDAEGAPGHDSSGEFVCPIPLNYAAPVRRYRVQARLKVHNQLASVLLVKPSQLEESTSERTFFVALRPRWKESRHQVDALIRAQLMATGRMRGLQAWLDYSAQVRRAGASPEDAKKFDPAHVASVLGRLERVASRQVTDPELKEAARYLVEEAQKLSGTLPDKDGLKLKAPQGGGEYQTVAHELSVRAGQLSTAVTPLVYLKTYQATAKVLRLEERLESMLEAAAIESRSLQSLWMVNSAVDLAGVLARYQKALAGEQKAIAELGRALERELGRDYKARAWKKIQESRIFKSRVPARAPGDKIRVAELTRSIYQGLYYFLKAERYRVAVLASAASSGLAPIRDLDRMRLPDFESEVPEYPVDLQVRPDQTAKIVERGGVAEYALVIRHAGNRPREVRLQYATVDFAAGWHRKLTDTSFRLRPGQSKRVVYAVSTPKTAPEPDNVRSALLLYYADQPASHHRIDFLTRMTAGGRRLELQGPDWDQPDRLRVQSLDSHDHIFPGQVATYRFLVTHEGYHRRGVKGRIVNPPPKDFVVKLSPGRIEMSPGQQEEFLLKVSAPLTARKSSDVNWEVVFAYDDELTDPERVHLRTSFTGLTVLRSRPLINRGKVATYHLPPGLTTQALLLENRGNESDTYDLSVFDPAEGWYVHFPTNHIVLSPERPVAKLAFETSPPRDAEGGAFTHVGIRMVSANHPEVVTTATVTLVKSGEGQVLVAPVEPRILIAPGQTRDIVFLARNRSEDAVDLAFKPDTRNPLPEALDVDEVPLSRLEPEAELEMNGTVTLPDGLDYRPGQVIPVGIAGYDSFGGKIVTGHADLVVAPRYGIQMRLFSDDVRRSPGLMVARLSLRNTGTVPEQYVLLLSGKRRTWGRLSRTRMALDPGHHSQVTLYVRVPSDVQHGQVALLEVQAKSVHDSSVRAFVRVDAAP
ncbi:MAG: hypothetical protein HY303_17625 [Candidatus Wallbacteria bacterium]|nr:hypothetical protein [Candidatus Wallbacteria bacterium]